MGTAPPTANRRATPLSLSAAHGRRPTHEPTRAPRYATPVLAFAFVLSGAAGLVYESIWTRYISLFVGHSAYAQIIVLVIFLGGMSLGALAVGERAARVESPLLWYCGAELAVGLIGLLFHGAFVAVTDAAYAHWLPALAGGVLHVVAKWGIAGLLILPQSILLGTTFPLMSSAVLRLRARRSGHVVSLLYFANSLGAAIGVLVAGFVLLAALGLPGTLFTAALMNFAVVLVVWLLVRYGGVSATLPPVAADAPLPVGERPASLGRLLLAVSFGTALSSFIYEIGWIRMLSLVLGSATHSFELMLSAFILGLALGAYWVRQRADSFADPVRALGIVQWAMGALALATLPLYVESFHLSRFLVLALARSDAGYRLYGLARYAMCLLVMLPATFCAGMTLPLITRTLMQTGSGERAVGRVYGVNTIGSIAGAALAGLVLMPLVGLERLVVIGAAIDLAIGAVLVVHAWKRGGEWPRFVVAGVAATAALVVAVVGFTRFDRAMLTSGVYRYGTLGADAQVVFYADGRTATVSVRRDSSELGEHLALATNGKPDASLDTRWMRPYHAGEPLTPLMLDQATQVLIPVVTLAHSTNPRTVAVIGEGSGMTSHFALGDDRVRRLYTIEIEPQMIRGSRLFYPANWRTFDDPRSHFVIDDAKSFFAASGQRFDAILSEPSNPWVSGVSGLFTVEFYRRVRQQLAPDGVFGQWLHLYEIDDRLVLSVLTAIDQVFPDYAVYQTDGGDILVVASNAPKLRPADWSVVQRGAIAQDLRRVLPLTPTMLASLRIADRDALHPLLAIDGTANSDYYPALDLGAERTRFLRALASGTAAMGSGPIDLTAALSGSRRGFADSQLPAVPEIERVREGAVGAILHAAWSGEPIVADTLPQIVRDALYRARTLQRGLAQSAAPSDWLGWTAALDTAEHELHVGTAGVADDAFFRAVHAYLARVHAPGEPVAAVAFLHGLAVWDWAEASSAAETLIPIAQRGTDWVPLDVLREGAALAHLEQHDPRGAAGVFKRLAERTGPGERFRDRVLAAQVLAQERAYQPGVAPPPGR